MSTQVQTGSSTPGVSDALIKVLSDSKGQPLSLRGLTALLVLEQEGPMLTGELARKMSAAKTTTWRMVNGLIELGLVKWMPVAQEDNKRIRGLVKLSPRGAKLIKPLASRLH